MEVKLPPDYTADDLEGQFADEAFIQAEIPARALEAFLSWVSQAIEFAPMNEEAKACIHALLLADVRESQ